MNSPLMMGHEIKVQVCRGGRVLPARPGDVNRLTKRGFAVAGKAPGNLGHTFDIGGFFKVVCYRADGTKRWTKHVKNGIVNQGLNKLLNVMFQGATQITTWYLDLIDTGATLAAADTYASHGGWVYATEMSNATRPIWAPAASSAQSSTNSATVDFNINGTADIFGIAVVAGSATKADAAAGSGVLWATGAFPGGEQPVVNGDTLKVTYTVNASAA